MKYQKSVKYFINSILGSIFLILTSCVTLHQVEIDELIPAEITLPPGIKTLGIVHPNVQDSLDASLNPETAAYLAEYNLNSSDITGSILNGFRDAMDYSPRFQYIDIHSDLNIAQDTSDYIGLSGWEQIRQVCHDSVLDALVVLKFRDIIDEVHLAVKEDIDLELEGYIKVVNSWKIVDPVEMAMLENYTDTVPTFSFSESDYLELLFSMRSARNRAALDASYWSGQEYAYRITPLWETATRKYYTWPGDVSKKAKEFIDQDDWLSAARLWKSETSNPKSSVAAVACLNMAVACEMEDNLEVALYWAKQSDSLVPYKIITLDYMEVLQQRLKDRVKLDEQMEVEVDSSTRSALTVMTYNIRFNNPDDGPNAWPNRREAVNELISRYNPDLLGVQEALFDQIHDIDNGLGHYSWFGAGRDDGIVKGEFSAIFYRDDRFELLDGATFWLSETPDVPGSMGWDAACPRVVTWVKLKDRSSGEILFHFNTHFDHMGDTARMESTRLLMSRIKEIAGDYPVIITGDFNLRESEDPYLILTDESKDFHLTDTRHRVKPAEGPDYTYMGFDFVGEPGEIIDYIFVRNFNDVISHQINTDNNNGIYPSDHLPVLARILLK